MGKDNVKKFFEELAKSQPLKEKFLRTMRESHEDSVMTIGIPCAML